VTVTADHGPAPSAIPVAIDKAPVLAPPTPVGPDPARSGATRGRRQSALLRLRGEIPPALRMGLAVAGLGALVGVWIIGAATTRGDIVPTPWATIGAIGDLWRDGVLWSDIWASTRRIALGYGISVTIAVVLGVSIGSFRSVEAFSEASIGFLRYIPANALLPIFLVWMGIDETPKVALVVVGTVFFNTLMIADVARGVPRELIAASYTLGAGRLTVLRRVILPHSLPGIVDVTRINLAAAWVMLVVSELLAANDGLAYRILRANRFRQYDRMFAVLVIFGVIGILSDLALRWLRGAVAPWAKP
jgi:NitT/TauT family transport system permease protein